MKRWIRYIRRMFRKAPQAPKPSAREKAMERQWADLLRYEGRPLYDADKD